MPRTDNPGLLTKMLSSHVLSAFLSDIGRQTERGLNEVQCKKNLEWLKQLADITATIPDGGLGGRRVFERMEDFADTYEKWNYPNKSPDHREKYRKKLRRKANKVATTYRVRTQLLMDGVDIEVYRRYYMVTSDFVQRLPDLVPDIAEVLKKFPTPR